jgi:hypothetical protein
MNAAKGRLLLASSQEVTEAYKYIEMCSVYFKNQILHTQASDLVFKVFDDFKQEAGNSGPVHSVAKTYEFCFSGLKFIIEFVYHREIDVSQAELQVCNNILLLFSSHYRLQCSCEFMGLVLLFTVIIKQ